MVFPMKDFALKICVLSLLVVGVRAAQAQEATAPDTIHVQSDTVVLRTDDGQEIVVVIGDERGDRPIERRGQRPVRVWVHPDGEGVREFRRFEADLPRRFVFRDFDHEGDFSVDDFRLDFDAFAPDLDALQESLDFPMRGLRIEVESHKERAEIARMDAESRQLARKVRQAEGAEREQFQQELEDMLNEIYERKLALRQQRLETLEQELEAQQDQIETREQARQEIIERRMQELLGERDMLDW